MTTNNDANFQRADPNALTAFDPRTKVCTMNCGPTVGDPRSPEERRFLCQDCVTVSVVTQAEKMSRLSTELYALKSTISGDSAESWRLFWALHDAAWCLAVYANQVNAEGQDTRKGGVGVAVRQSSPDSDAAQTTESVDSQANTGPAPSAPNAEPPQTVSVTVDMLKLWLACDNIQSIKQDIRLNVLRAATKGEGNG